MPEKGNSTTDNVAILREKANGEPIASLLNMKLVELSPGYAKIEMKLVPEHVNFNGLIFGGIIMSLADEAFAYATNSIITPNVASQFNIHFSAGAKVGDTLIAECKVIKSGKRVCISEMMIADQEGKLIARATGTTIPLI
jgi:acyl-CoA thioesterase